MNEIRLEGAKMREIPAAAKYLLDRYGSEFREIFHIELGPFIGKLWIIGIPDFDIVKFDKYMETRRNYDERNISLAEFIEKRYGKRGKELIDKLLNVGIEG